ncbi:MAG: flagellinolysin [Lachnospiraceae bacterium]|nr:flagellinolysin [Lachnospiraceae bacterium]
MNVTRHNLQAFNANRQLGIVTGIKAKSSEKLSSGYKINRAADDAAGLSISEKMRRQIRGLTQASKNAQDGISLIQIADGAMNEDHDMLQRMNELAVKAANDTLQTDDRSYIDAEVQKLKEEITSTARKTTFNEIKTFPPNGYSPKEAVRGNVVAEQRFDITLASDGTFTISDPMTSVPVTGVSAGEGWQVLAAHIADELIPNAVSQVLDAFPSLKTAGNNVNLALEVSYIDGQNGTLAYAGYRYYGNGTTATPDPTGFRVRVDSSDFSDETIGSSREGVLESTLAHELTHTIMQNTMTSGMAYGFPDWFVEGTAQLAGGGFTTGWNEYLQAGLNGAGGIADENDTSKDAWIEQKLKSRTVESNVYGHGYLAAAYLGYMANGGGEVSAAGIAAGMDRIFAKLLANGNDLDAAINEVTGGALTGAADVASAINTADPGAVEFVRKLVKKTGNGAGSVIAAGGLSAGGSGIVGTGETNPGNYTIDGNVDVGARKLVLQVGAEYGHELEIKMFKMSAEDLGLTNVNVKTATNALSAIETIKDALQMVSAVRSYYGATQNRLEHTIRNLDNVVENTSTAESLIRDTDMSEEMMRYANTNILQQAGQAILTQANQSHQGILTLLS